MFCEFRIVAGDAGRVAHGAKLELLHCRLFRFDDPLVGLAEMSYCRSTDALTSESSRFLPPRDCCPLTPSRTSVGRQRPGVFLLPPQLAASALEQKIRWRVLGHDRGDECPFSVTGSAHNMPMPLRSSSGIRR